MAGQLERDTPPPAAPDPCRRRTRHIASRRAGAHPARTYRRPDRPRRRPRGRGPVHRRASPSTCAFSATGLRELAKMDGAVVLDTDATADRPRERPAGARPAASPPRSPAPGTAPPSGSSEQTGYPVISRQPVDAHHRVVRRRSTATSWRTPRRSCRGPTRRWPPSSATSCGSTRCPGTLSALEIEDLVTVRDVAAVAQRLEMVRRIAGEIEGYVVELGTDGRLLSLQLDELIAGVEHRPRADRPRLPARAERATSAQASRTCSTELDGLGAPSCSTSAPSPARWASAPRPDVARLRRQPARLPAARQGAAAAAAWSSTGWSSTSADCRSCWPRASTTCRRSRASARAAPGRCARACRGWPSRQHPRALRLTQALGWPDVRRAACAGAVSRAAMPARTRRSTRNTGRSPVDGPQDLEDVRRQADRQRRTRPRQATRWSRRPRPCRRRARAGPPRPAPPR